MNKKGFKTWLKEKGHAPETVSSRISSAKRVERELGDLDKLFSEQKKEKVLEQFHYSTADKREQRPNPSDVPIKGDLKDGLASIRRALNLYHEFFETRQNRARIEAGFDAHDSYRTNGAHSEIFGGFGKPQKFWVRSSRERGNRVYPTKPINGFVNTDYGGGFGAPLTAASVLHNAGFIIVSEDDTPVEVPSKPFLEDGADRIGRCALNYFVEPAREKSVGEVSIRASDLAKAMGLENAYRNICQALGGEKFQKMANVAPPKSTEPNPSSSTVFTYTLNSQPETDPVTDASNAPASSAVNLILYGPPGTGKTFSTAKEAVRLCGEPVPEDRDDLMAVYQSLLATGRIEFVTFHQSMAYEEFVEGRQPMTGADDGEDTSTAGFRLETVPGIFRRIARRAEVSCGTVRSEAKLSLEGRRVFKMSIGKKNMPEDAPLFEEAIEKNCALLGFYDFDLSNPRFESQQAILAAAEARLKGDPQTVVSKSATMMTDLFRNSLKTGDILIVTKGDLLVRAIGVVEGEYEFLPIEERGDYVHRRAVNWRWVDRDGIDAGEVSKTRFIPRTIYEIDKTSLNVSALERYMNSRQNEGPPEPEPFVLIIDEINRANISKVFGELITLLETDKRLGQPNQLKVRLPYSGDEFSVPSNLHIIGTMNTTDRSIALLDMALRRRFIFREMMPDSSVLADAADRTGIDLRRLLSIINERIEYLVGRDCQIGHAYFTTCETRTDVDEAMRHKVIPLLAEYFFEDWAKIAAVLGDLETDNGPIKGGFLTRSVLKTPPGLDNGETMPRFRWEVRSVEDGFEYERLLGT